MIFTSIFFLAVFPLMALLITWVPSAKIRNAILLLASYALYLIYMPKGAIILGLLTIISFFCAQKLETSVKRKKVIAVFSVITAISFLFVFKYLNFFLQNLNDVHSILSIHISFESLDIIMPIGISYFTFQIIAYLVDVYKGRIKAEHNFIDYALFIAYYVKLMAGPLVDSRDFLLQLKTKRNFEPEQFLLGVQQILWGWFMKLCIAERVSPYVDSAFGAIQMHSGTTFILAATFYMFQIYADFAGYSLLAIGTSKCLGLELPHNFNMPYLSLNIKEFWRGWHISLTTWLTQYVYIPLGGSRRGKARKYLNIMIVFLLSGLWHGANWSFIAWGAVHGIAMCIQTFCNEHLPDSLRKNAFWKIFAFALTFLFIWFSWIFFRADTITDAFTVIRQIITDHGALFNGDGKPNQLLGILGILILMASEIKDKYFSRIKFLFSPNAVITSCSMIALIVYILTCAVLDASSNFIYFKF